MAAKSNKNRDKPIFVRLTSHEHRKVAAAARDKGLGISAFVRMVLRERLGSEAVSQ